MSVGGGGIPRHGRFTRPKPDMPFGATDAEHPQPPAELSEEEAEIWRGIVNKMPPTFFAEPTWPMLISLCRHVRAARLFAQQSQAYEAELPRAINNKRHEILRTIAALSRAQSGESRTIAMLSTRLKITQLCDSTNVHKARRSFLREQKPWEVPDDNEGDELQ